MSQELYIGLDLGGTRIRAALLNKDLEVLKRSETLTDANEGKDAIIKRMVEQAKLVWPNNSDKVTAIGISAPGPINPMEGMIVAPPNLPGWHNVPLSQLIADATGV